MASNAPSAPSLYPGNGTGSSRGAESTRARVLTEGSALLSPEDVAVQCALSRKTVYRAIERGDLRASRLGSRIRVRPEDVDAWIERHVIPVPSAPSSRARLGFRAPRGLRSLVTKPRREAAR